MRAGYERIARIYDRLNALVFGKAMIQSQTVFFDQLIDCRKILVVGGGTGLWLNDLMDQFPQLEITFVDSSAEMIRIAKENLKSYHHVNFVHSPLELFLTKEHYDAVMLFYFLDLFSNEDLPGILRNVKQRLNSNSLWLVTDFVQEKKWHAFMLQVMYSFFRFTTGLKTRKLPDWENELNKPGLIKMKQKSFYYGFMRSIIYQSN